MTNSPKYLLFFAFISFSHGTVADAKSTKSQALANEVPSSEMPGLNVGDGVSDKIYQQSTLRSSEKTSNDVSIESSIRAFFPVLFELKNEYFTVSYSENSKNFVGFIVGPEIPLTTFGHTELGAFANVGFAYAQGIYQIQSESGLDVRDAIELQWMLFQSGLELTSRPMTSQNITLGFQASVGMDWLTQNGNLDGIAQTFWIPRFEIGPRMTLFAPTKVESGGFSGIHLAAVFYDSFATEQTNRGYAADVGVRYAF